MTLRAVLQPSADDPGALNLIAEVSRQAVSGLASFDNRAFVQTGPIEGLGVLDFNSQTELGEKTEVTYYHTFPNSQNFGQLAEEMFLGGSGLKLRLYAGTGNAIPTGGGPSGLAAENYHGTTSVFGAVLSYPVIRSRQQTLNVYTSLDGLISNVNTGMPQVLTSYDSLRVLRLGEDYAMSDLWLGAARPANNVVSVRLSQGLPILGAETNGTAPDAARQGEDSNFFKINFMLSRTQTLFTPFSGSSVALMGLLGGQWSENILPPAEQFYLGGSQYTRGYYSGQIPGDKALVGDGGAAVQHRHEPDDVGSVGGRLDAVLPVLRLGRDLAEPVDRLRDNGELVRWRRAHAGDALHRGGFRGAGPVQPLSDGVGRRNVAAQNGIGLYWHVLGHF